MERVGLGGHDCTAADLAARVALVRSLPMASVAVHGVLPPLRILNEVLVSGECCGPSGERLEWEPFALTGEAFDEIARRLTRGSDAPMRRLDPPDWVARLFEWEAWTDHHFHAVPLDPHIEIARAAEAAAAREEAARDAGILDEAALWRARVEALEEERARFRAESIARGQGGLQAEAVQERVRHPRFGEGLVLRTFGAGHGAKVEVDFGPAGRRTLLRRFVEGVST